MFVIAALGCSSSGPAPAPTDGGGVDAGASDGGSSGAVCVRQHDDMLGSTPIVVCDEAFAVAPFVHLAADSSTGGVDSVYGAIGGDLGNYGFLARGRSLSTSPTVPTWAEPEATITELRYGYFLYRATVRGGVVESVTPVVRIDDRVFARLLGGIVLEGGVSPRSVDPGTGEVSFAFDDLTTPVRIRFDAAPAETESDRISGFPRFALVGHIENFDAAVTAADGACLASLTSLGAANPYFGADGSIRLLRYPGMHVRFQDVFTLAFDASDNVNMGDGLFIGAADLIQDAAPTLTDGSNRPHLPPTAGPSAALTAVDGSMGGAACTP